MNQQEELVIGCGPVGRSVLRHLATQGIPAVAASRSRPEGLEAEWVKLDATDSSAVARLAGAHSTTYLCAAPPLTAWLTEFEPLVKGVLDGMRGTDTTLVSASNLYAYGPPSGVLTEDSPEAGTTARCRLRARLDRAVLEVDSPRTAVVRASSFYGPQVATSRAGAAEIRAMKEGKPVPALGSVDQPHSMTYIDDFGRAMARVAHEPSAHGQVWHAPMQPALSGRELLSEFAELLQVEPKFRIAGPVLVKMLGLFNPTMKALQDTYYSHAQPFVASSQKYEEAFGDTPTTVSAAVEATLRDLDLPQE